MLVFAGLVPNSPLLLPSINQDRFKEAIKTRAALEELAEELFASHPDTIILLAEGLTMYPDAFAVNIADPYVTDLSEFGDLGVQKKYHPDFSFVDALQRASRKTENRVVLDTDEKLNFSSAIPLDFLTGHLPDIHVVPVAPSRLTPKMHFEFGGLLKNLAQEHHHRIAIVVGGNLSHALSDEAPAGKKAEGKIFDERLNEILEYKNTAGLLQLDAELVEGAHEAAYRQLCMLFGALEGIDVSPHILSYEAPFGVGYSVAHFHLR